MSAAAPHTPYGPHPYVPNPWTPALLAERFAFLTELTRETPIAQLNLFAVGKDPHLPWWGPLRSFYKKGGAEAPLKSDDAECDGTVAYNGICTPRTFPPRQNYSRQVPHPPYLDAPPAVINISLGRQLWVDSFLIEKTNATQTWHAAEYIDDNPVLKPDREPCTSLLCSYPHESAIDASGLRTEPWEGTFAMPFSGGSFWEEEQERIALWYRCGGGYAEGGGETQVEGRSGPSDTGTCVACTIVMLSRCVCCPSR